MRIISGNTLTPKKMKDLYYDLCIAVGDTESQAGSELEFKHIDGVEMRKYLMAAYWPSDDEKRKALEEATDDKSMKRKARIKKHQDNYLKPRKALYGAWKKAVGRDKETREALRQAYNGKGWPQDYELALEIAADVGKSEATRAALQAFADKYFGIDCSGFVNAYFQTKGKLNGRASWLIRKYAQKTPRNSLTEVQQDDCLIQMNKDGSLKTGPGHIMLVQGRIAGVDSEGKDDILQVVESCGGKGIHESNYQLTKDKKTKSVGKGSDKFEVFYLDRGIKGKGAMWVKIVKPF